jgi:acyl carrier protein
MPKACAEGESWLRDHRTGVEATQAGFFSCRSPAKPVGGSLSSGARQIMTAAFDDSEDVERTLRAVLADVLGLDSERVRAFDANSALFGALPEFDSMAVAGLLTELEERLGIVIEDHEVDADMLETFGSLLTFAKAKTLR